MGIPSQMPEAAGVRPGRYGPVPAPLVGIIIKTECELNTPKWASGGPPRRHQRGYVCGIDAWRYLAHMRRAAGVRPGPYGPVLAPLVGIIIKTDFELNTPTL